MSAVPASGPLRLAFLGCGRVADLHSRTLRGFPGEVSCLYASRDRERAEAMNARCGGEGSFGSYEDALGDPRVDAVLVATPPALHLEWALRALAAGKHVILEKPPVLRAADFQPLRQAADAASRQVLVAENYFYKPLAETLRRLLAEEAVGDVLFVNVNAVKSQPTGGWRDDPALAGGGSLLEGGIHWIDFMAHLGLTVTSAQGFTVGRPSALERSLTVVLRYAEGAVGTLSHSWEVPSPLRGLRLSRIHGRAGSITFESNGLFVLAWGRRRRLSLPGLRDIAGYRAMFADFLAALRTGRPPRFDLERARRDVEIVEEVYRSLRRGGGAAAA